MPNINRWSITRVMQVNLQTFGLLSLGGGVSLWTSFSPFEVQDVHMIFQPQQSRVRMAMEPTADDPQPNGLCPLFSCLGIWSDCCRREIVPRTNTDGC